LQIKSQTGANSTEQIHSLRLLHAHEAGLQHFSVRVEISHTTLLLDDLWIGFEITE
jgi:hypothetical protein